MVINLKPYYFIPHCHWCQLPVPHIIWITPPLSPRTVRRLERGSPRAYLPLRPVALPEASERVYDAWLDDLDGRLSAPGADWHRITRDVLFGLWYPGLSDYDALVEDPATPPVTRASLLALDPRNVTLEPEYYADVDAERYARVKPLHWLWQSFDRTPLGGGNVQVGVRFRRILAPHLFARVGRNFKCFHFVEFSYGYNLEVGDDCVIHRYVLLDDRGGITL
ncbi:MAG TPA: hypothetical protein VF720_00455, partial [Candidatus Eisenbacteria bacterium]